MMFLFEMASIRLSRRARFLLLALAVGLSAGFALAASLVPDPFGQGTHRQLGFPSCTILILFGWPCPLCGMTTCFAHFVRGHWIQAAQVQPAGLLLAFESLLLLLFSLISAVRGTLVLPVQIERCLLALMTTNLLVVSLFWITRLLCG